MILQTRRMDSCRTRYWSRGLSITLGGEEMTLRMVEAESIPDTDERPI